MNWINGKPASICRHAFGTIASNIGEIVLLMERDRTEQYKGSFDNVLAELKGGVFNGITGEINGVSVSAIYSKGPADIGDCVAFLGLSKTKCHTIFSNGSIGGIGKNIDVGDFLIVDEACGNDGFSNFLKKLEGNSNPGLFSNKLNARTKISIEFEKKAKEICGSFGVNCHRGKIFTIPGVCFESKELLESIKKQGFAAVDMETAQFYAACEWFNFNSLAMHWVTDLPLKRNYAYAFEGKREIAERDWKKKHLIWLNLAKINTKFVKEFIKTCPDYGTNK